MVQSFPITHTKAEAHSQPKVGDDEIEEEKLCLYEISKSFRIHPPHTHMYI